MSVETSSHLRCHANAPYAGVRAIEAHLHRTTEELELSFRLNGDVSRICLLPNAEAPDTGELWRHTCFEVFVAIEGQKVYNEFNFAPSGKWRAYRFLAYRERDPAFHPLRSPITSVRVTDVSLELDIRIALLNLSEIHPASPLRVGLSAVVEARNALSYWALHHPGAQPDFHHPDSFALRIPAP